jgi:ketosteroid isomerase-like protein
VLIDTLDVSDEAHLSDVERRRLRALVAKDLDAAMPLHADDYQLVTPGGGTLSKQDYLEGIRSGLLDYRVFEPDGEIAARVVGDAGIVRYRVRIEIVVDGSLDTGTMWHTDYYERREGRWQVVWSHATRIRA